MARTAPPGLMLIVDTNSDFCLREASRVQKKKKFIDSGNEKADKKATCRNQRREP
jgi:hypothetical protein